MRLWYVKFLLLVLYIGGVWYGGNRPLPSGIRVAGPEREVRAQDVSFFADRTFLDAAGERQTDQEIFDEVLRMIDGAKQYLLLDMFLYNAFQGFPPEDTRALADELTDALVLAKENTPELEIVVISDPLNTVYGGAASPQFEALRAAGITVVETDLTKLRDSNPLYSSLWRLGPQWFGNSVGGVFSHPFDAKEDSVSLRSWLRLVNFKANHRKLVVADELVAGQRRMATLVTSANPHDGSSAHSNVAIKVVGELWRDAFASEQATAKFSGAVLAEPEPGAAAQQGVAKAQLLTEGAIRDAIVRLLRQMGTNDQLDIAMFYLSDRDVIEGIAAASRRGANVRLLLDPNKDAFGHTKNGVPNRPVAHELLTSGSDIQIRWCDTHGEQCHTKLLLFTIGEERSMMVGSANLTRRNIGDYNLETNILVRSESTVPAISSAQSFFDEQWTNAGERTYTARYERYADDSAWKSTLYRIQERTGLSSF